STTTPSFAQMYCCFKREPQSLCSRLKEIAFEDCVALYSLTGIATRPNEIVNEPIERAAMGRPLCLASWPSGQPAIWPEKCQRRVIPAGLRQLAASSQGRGHPPTSDTFIRHFRKPSQGFVLPKGHHATGLRPFPSGAARFAW